MKDRSLFLLILIFCAAFVVACGGDAEEGAEEPTATAVVTEAAASTEAPTEEPTPTVPPTPTATPVPPEIVASYQIVDLASELVVDQVTTPRDSWLVVYPDSRLELSADLVLGYTAVSAGTESDVVIELPEDLDLTSLQLALHAQNPIDAGEFIPTADNLILIQALEIDTLATIPTLTISDQALIQNEEETDGYILVDAVTCPTAAWVAVYPADDVERNNLLGYAPIPSGGAVDIPVFLRWRDAPSHLQVVVLEDAGETSLFERDLDQPFVVGDKTISTDVRITMPPNILVYSQPVADSFVVERVISDGPGWLVAYEDADGDGQPGFIIGSAPLVDGLNELVEVEVDGTAVSDNMLITLHHDTGTIDEFDFPANDPRQEFGDIARFSTFRTDLPALLLTQPQDVSDDSVMIPRAVVGQSAWVTIHADEDGSRGEDILGIAWLPTGYNVDVEISLDAETDSELLYAVLHQDIGEEELFEPEEFDFTLKLRGVDIFAPIFVSP